MIVWMSTLRRGLTYHHRLAGERKTVCGRFIGAPALPPERGYLLGRIEAMDLYGAQECGQCSGASYGESRPDKRGV